MFHVKHYFFVKSVKVHAKYQEVGAKGLESELQKLNLADIRSRPVDTLSWENVICRSNNESNKPKYEAE